MEKKKSKKLLAILAMGLMLALIAGMGAITYSKYVTSTTAPSQSATAAKWGFVVTADASNLFGTQYKQTDATNHIATKVAEGGVAVVASTTSNVVAPGTSGSMTFSINGSAEVYAKLTVVSTSTSEIALGDYKPVVWTLNDGTSDVKTGTLAEVVTYLNATSANINANTAYNKNYTLTWKWAFDGNNMNDTIIGYKAQGKSYDDIKDIDGVSAVVANADAYNAISTTMDFALTISVEQIQA